MTSVLIVEDNATLLESIAFELEMRDYSVMQATDGQSALNVLQVSQQLPDIIVSDIAMPDMDGYEFLENVRGTQEWVGIPFIFLTAFDTDGAMRIGKELGVDDYLTKPFDPEDLVLAMENKLRRHKQITKQASMKLDQTRRELLNLISHELQTPMTSIYGGTEMLAEMLSNTSDEMTGELLKLVQSGSKRLHKVIKRILLMVQLDSGMLETMLTKQRRDYDLIEVIQGAISQNIADEAYKDEDRKINFHTDSNNIMVSGLYEFLLTVFVEGIDNALKFSPVNKPIDIRVITTQDSVSVEIEDQGRGIIESDLDAVWERFNQSQREEFEQQGSGIGLSIINEIVQVHGGSCNLQSIFGEGSMLTVTLPLA